MAKRTRKAKAPKTAPKRAGRAFTLQDAAEWARLISDQIPEGEVCDIERDLIWKKIDEFNEACSWIAGEVKRQMAGLRVAQRIQRLLWKWNLRVWQSMQTGKSVAAKWRMQQEIPSEVCNVVHELAELLTVAAEVTRADLDAMPTKGVREVLECWRRDETEWERGVLSNEQVRMRLAKMDVRRSTAAVQKRRQQAVEAGWLKEVFKPRRGFVITSAGKAACSQVAGVEK